jgi:hypothetical protein
MKVSREFLEFIVEPEVRKMSKPLFFATSDKTAEGNIKASGSFGLVDTGERKLLVTCNHVWEDFKKKRLEHPNLMFCVSLNGPTPYILTDVESLFIDGDKRSDLATFEMDDELVSLCNERGLQFYNLRANPHPKVQKGDILYLIGYPGKGRRDEENAIGFPLQVIGINAMEVGEFHFFGNLENFDLNEDDFGGVSGSPCFVIQENKPIRLVGFTTGYSGLMNRLQFTYVNQITPEGVIHYMR